MKKRKRNIIIVALVIFFVLVPLLSRCEFTDPADTQAPNSVSDVSQSSDKSDDSFIQEIRSAISGSIGEGESFTDVSLSDGNVCIAVDLSKADTSILSVEDIAVSRASSITDAFLDISGFDDLWDTITIDFGDIGKITVGKDQVKTNEYGMRYFDESKFVLE